MATQIKQCDCTGTPATEYQDKIYGKRMRLHNEGAKDCKCTCC